MIILKLYVNADNVKTTVCDKEARIEEIIRGAKAPYRICEGYVKEESIYKKEN